MVPVVGVLACEGLDQSPLEALELGLAQVVDLHGARQPLHRCPNLVYHLLLFEQLLRSVRFCCALRSVVRVRLSVITLFCAEGGDVWWGGLLAVVGTNSLSP